MRLQASNESVTNTFGPSNAYPSFSKTLSTRSWSAGDPFLPFFDPSDVIYFDFSSRFISFGM